MSTIRDRHGSRAFPALTVLLTLVWLVSVAAPASANGPAAHLAAATSANGRVAMAAMVRHHRVLGGLVANRRAKSGRYGSILLGMQTGALETTPLVAAGSGSPAADHRRRRTQPALVDARAPPLLQLA
jgi:hypothetical protein